MLVVASDCVDEDGNNRCGATLLSSEIQIKVQDVKRISSKCIKRMHCRPFAALGRVARMYYVYNLGRHYLVAIKILFYTKGSTFQSHYILALPTPP